MSDREHLELLLRVARRYWIDQVSQAEIAEEIGYSRSMVSRLLDDARRQGVVKFNVGHPLERALELEKRLCDAYGLNDARVSMTSAATDPGEAAGLAVELLLHCASKDAVIAITNGHAVPAVVRAVPRGRHSEVTVVQAIGAIALENNTVDSPDICRELAGRMGATYRILPAPLVVRSPAMAAALRKEDTVSMTMSMASHADVLLTGVGVASAVPVGSIFDHFLSEGERKELIDGGAVGHVCGHHFDASGHHVDGAFCQRLMAVPSERICGVPHSIGVAWGEGKVRAIKGALRGAWVNSLVTDLPTAQQLLAA